MPTLSPYTAHVPDFACACNGCSEPLDSKLKRVCFTLGSIVLLAIILLLSRAKCLPGLLAPLMRQTSHALVTGALPRYSGEPLDSKLERMCFNLVSIVSLGIISLFESSSAQSVASQVPTPFPYAAHVPDLASRDVRRGGAAMRMRRTPVLCRTPNKM